MQIFSESLLKQQPTPSPGPSTSNETNESKDSLGPLKYVNEIKSPPDGEYNSVSILPPRRNGSRKNSQASDEVHKSVIVIENLKLDQKLNGTLKIDMTTNGVVVPSCAVTPSTSHDVPRNLPEIDPKQPLSPFHVTEGMLRVVHGITSTYTLPRSTESHVPQQLTLLPLNPALITLEDKTKCSPSTSTAVSATAEPNDAPVKEDKAIRKGHQKDPETGLTLETVRRRDLCKRFESMLNGPGVNHRLSQLPHMTSIQVAGLLRRSRNRPEFSEISDEVWANVFDEKRKGEDKTAQNNPYNMFSKDFCKKLNQMNIEDMSEMTDSESDKGIESGEEEPRSPVFEEITNLEAETPGSHSLLASMGSYYETRRKILAEERWLQLQIKRLTEKRDAMKSFNARSSSFVFAEPVFNPGEDQTEKCARCMPLIVKTTRHLVYAGCLRTSNDENIDIMETCGVSRDVQIENYLHDLSVGLDEEQDLLIVEEKKQGRPRRLEAKTDALTLAKARARYYARRNIMLSVSGAQRRNVGRPRKFPLERSSLKKAMRQKELNKKRFKNSSAFDREKRLSVVVPPVLPIVEEREIRIVEEQLHRFNKDFVYKEITVPQFRKYDEQLELSFATKRKVSFGSDYIADEDERCDEMNEALVFARIHHMIEFPHHSDAEIRRRKKEKINFIPDIRPFVPDMYAHEDPISEVLKVYVVNSDPEPFPSHYAPGLHVEKCSVVHEDPVMLDLTKTNQIRCRMFQRVPKSTTTPNRSRSCSPLPPDGCARARAYFMDQAMLLIDTSFTSASNSPLLTPNTDSLGNTPSPHESSFFSSSNSYLDFRRRNTIPTTAQCTVPAAQRNNRLCSDPVGISDLDFPSPDDQLQHEDLFKTPKVETQ